MRGDAALTLRLLLHGQGLAGLAVVLGGLVLLSASVAPWWRLLMVVDMLGSSDATVVATRSLPAVSPLGWVLVAGGVAAVVVGVGVAVDRPVPGGWLVALGVGATAAAVLAAAVLSGPTTGELAPEQTERLAALADRLPMGVELDVAVGAGGGAWAGAVGVLLVLLGAAGAREDRAHRRAPDPATPTARD